MTQLVPMTQQELNTFRPALIKDFAESLVQSGRMASLENAREKATKDLDQLLPQGLQTEGQYLFSIFDEKTQTNVGVLWFAKQTQEQEAYAFVYEISVVEEHRRKGHARRAFQLMEEKVKELGLKHIALNVFGFNVEAQALYQSLGYQTVSMIMKKQL